MTKLDGRTKDELQQALAEQRAALAASAASYDAGNLWEAKRLATTVYVLVHEGGRKSRSLLGQLGVRSDLQYVSTNMGVSDALAVPLCIIHMTGGKGATYAPRFAQLHERSLTLLRIGKWWEESIFLSSTGKELSRKNLVFALRSQEGGAHYDTALTDKTYEYLKSKGDGRWVVDSSKMELTLHPQGGGKGFPVANGHLASMRQIAWELEETLKKLPSEG